jgi:osmotically-inducible protein OsmY
MTQPDIGSGRFGPGRRGLDIADSVIWSRQAVDDRVDAVADAVANALYWDLALPRDRVVCRCNDGWVTLTGKVERAYQRSSAEADVWRVDGVRGVTNAITVAAAAHEIGAPRVGAGG